MPQSLAKITIHLIFSTKGRVPYFQDSDFRGELYAYMATIFRAKVDSPALLINGVEDHMHALVLLSRKYALMKVVQQVKTETTKWIKQQSPHLSDFSWQAGYGAFSVSESNISQVRNYIKNQEEHHREMNFQDEFRKLCDRHGTEIDERYVWD